MKIYKTLFNGIVTHCIITIFRVIGAVVVVLYLIYGGKTKELRIKWDQSQIVKKDQGMTPFSYSICFVFLPLIQKLLVVVFLNFISNGMCQIGFFLFLFIWHSICNFVTVNYIISAKKCVIIHFI